MGKPDSRFSNGFEANERDLQRRLFPLERIRSVATHRDELIVEERKKVATEAGDAAAMAELSELSGATE